MIIKSHKNMTRQFILISFIAIFACLISGCSDEANLQPLAADATILTFGDSLTYGTGTSLKYAYPSILQGLVNRKVINAGIPGEVSEKGLARLPGLITRHRPALIIICHGGNDILKKLNLSKTKNNLQQMIDLARQNNSQVILIGVPEFGFFLNTVPLYDELAAKNHVPIANEILADIITKNAFKSDHIHPNTQGYQLLAEEISALLKASGALPRE